MRMSVGTNGLFLKLGIYVYSALKSRACQNAFASAAAWLLAGWRAGLVLLAAWLCLAAWLPKPGLGPVHSSSAP